MRIVGTASDKGIGERFVRSDETRQDQNLRIYVQGGAHNNKLLRSAMRSITTQPSGLCSTERLRNP